MFANRGLSNVATPSRRKTSVDLLDRVGTVVSSPDQAGLLHLSHRLAAGTVGRVVGVVTTSGSSTGPVRPLVVAVGHFEGRIGGRAMK